MQSRTITSSSPDTGEVAALLQAAALIFRDGPPPKARKRDRYDAIGAIFNAAGIPERLMYERRDVIAAFGHLDIAANLMAHMSISRACLELEREALLAIYRRAWTTAKRSEAAAETQKGPGPARGG
jgi:hypothetical protein